MKLYERYHIHRRVQKHVISNNDFTYGLILRLIRKYAKRCLTVLDIGCGVGTIDFYLGQQGKKVLGLDVSKMAIKTARESAHKIGLNKFVNFVNMDFPKQKPKGKFELIILSEVVEHLKDDKHVVNEISKLLEKNGILIISSPSKNAPLYKWGWLNEFDKKVGHLRRYTSNDMRKLFEDKHFNILEEVKTEGLIRNFLFTNSFGGFLLKFLKRWPFSSAVTLLDNLTVKLFGESDIYMVIEKK